MPVHQSEILFSEIFNRKNLNSKLQSNKNKKFYKDREVAKLLLRESEERKFPK